MSLRALARYDTLARSARRSRRGRRATRADGRRSSRDGTGERVALPARRGPADDAAGRFRSPTSRSAAERAARGRSQRVVVPAMTPEVPSALSPLIRRVVANNPSLMTGPGTNTYLVGIDEVAVIDPGPDVAKHVESIVGAAMRDRVKWVLLTHTHPDHWPAADRIRKKTGALVGAFGKFPKADEVKLDLDLVLADGDTIDGTEFRLEAIAHARPRAEPPVLLPRRGTRRCSPATTCSTARPPSSTRSAAATWSQYLASLERLRKIKRVARICPGHGDVMDDPAAVLDEYVAHRKQRERQIMRLLAQGPGEDHRRRRDALHRHARRPPRHGRPPGARAPPEAQGRGQGHRQRRQVGLDAGLRWQRRRRGRSLRTVDAARSRGGPRWPTRSCSSTVSGPTPQSGETFPTFAPSTGEKIADVAKAGREDAQRAIEAARKAFDDGPWPKMSGKERAEKLRKVAEIITARAGEIAEIEARDGGGTIKKAMFADVPGCASTFESFAGCAENEPDVDRPRREPVPAREEHRAARAVRRVHRHRAVELPVPHGRLEDRPRDRGRQLRGAEARELHVAVGGRDGEGVRGGRHPAGRRQPHHRSRRQRGRGAGAAPARRQGRVHRFDRGRPPHHAARVGHREEGDARARRQVGEHRARRRRPRPRRRRRAVGHVLPQRPGVRVGHACAGVAQDLRRVRRHARGARGQDRHRRQHGHEHRPRPARRAEPGRHDRALREARSRRGRQAAVRWLEGHRPARPVSTRAPTSSRRSSRPTTR